MTEPKFRILAGVSAIALALGVAACSQPAEEPAPAEAEPVAAAPAHADHGDLLVFLKALLRDRDLAAPRVEIKCRAPHAI